MRTVVMRAPKAQATVIRPAVPVNASNSCAGPLAAFTVAMTKQPGPLLATLAEELEPAAQSVAARLCDGTSADRQAALAQHFGLRADARQRLRDVVIEAGP